MEEIVEELRECLCRKYGLLEEEADSIIYAEWETIEAILDHKDRDTKLCHEIAKSLLEIYMVA